MGDEGFGTAGQFEITLGILAPNLPGGDGAEVDGIGGVQDWAELESGKSDERSESANSLSSRGLNAFSRPADLALQQVGGPHGDGFGQRPQLGNRLVVATDDNGFAS